ncbi:MAG: co-chaperone GroES [Candidatus Shapirobacteria bacterium]
MIKSNLSLKLKPMPGYALIQPLEAEKQTAGGIILPDTHDEKSQRGKVVALGKAVVNDKGSKVEADFAKGNEVFYKKWGGEEIKLGISGKEYVFVKFEDVLAVVEK